MPDGLEGVALLLVVPESPPLGAGFASPSQATSSAMESVISLRAVDIARDSTENRALSSARTRLPAAFFRQPGADLSLRQKPGARPEQLEKPRENEAK
jgi:hypothetical protein